MLMINITKGFDLRMDEVGGKLDYRDYVHMKKMPYASTADLTQPELLKRFLSNTISVP